MRRDYRKRGAARFRQWTRKGYAVFSSLGHCVTIGQLRKNITECALAKQIAGSSNWCSPATQGDKFAGEEPLDNGWPTPEQLPITRCTTLLQESFSPPVNPLVLASKNRGINRLNAFCYSYFSLQRRDQQNAFRASVPLSIHSLCI